jgi:hypothetical protein
MNSGRNILASRGFSVALAVALVLAFASAAAHAQTLATYTNPPSGLAGTNDSYITASGVPTGTTTVTVSFAASCGGAVVATTPVTQIANEPPFKRFEFLIPASLKTGTYYVSVSSTSPAFNTAGKSCSQISVTATSTTLAACVPTSSLAVTAGTNVNAYVPFSSWGESETGVEEVPLEGTGTAAHLTTPGYVNSCASNSVTSEVVCTENGTNVDLINGSTVTTVSSSSNDSVGFSGGSCENCGVAVNAANNTAIIAGGFSGESGYGVQMLNLATNAFSTAFPLHNYVSEDVSIDSSRNLILSPGEDGVYDLIGLNSTTGVPDAEFGYDISTLGGGATLDSAAEDCTTGIALSASEFTDYVYITDLTQATYTSGTPGTWTAPASILGVGNGVYPASYGDSFSAGTSGISEAPGTNHLGVVTGEFGGSAYSVLSLPSSSGTGTPTLTDFAYVSSMPNTPDSNGFSAGYDPHTVTAYTSPNNSKSYAVFADWAPGYPDYLGVVDLACVLALERVPGTHIVNDQSSPTSTTYGNASTCTRYVAVP